MRYQAAAQNRYLSDKVSTANPAELVAMLFDGAHKAMGTARQALAEHRPGDVHQHLVKAQDIVTELRCSLNLEAGGDVAANLDAIYRFVHQLLVDANLHKDESKISQAQGLLAPLRDAWREACLGVAVAS